MEFAPKCETGIRNCVACDREFRDDRENYFWCSGQCQALWINYQEWRQDVPDAERTFPFTDPPAPANPADAEITDFIARAIANQAAAGSDRASFELVFRRVRRELAAGIASAPRSESKKVKREPITSKQPQ